MKQNKQLVIDNEIHLGSIIKKLWKEKILIFSISLFFVLIGYFFTNKLESEHLQIYKTRVTIRELPIYLIDRFKPYIKEQASQKSRNISFFDYDYMVNFSSVDNLIQFAEQNKDIGEFKTYLKNKNIDLRNFFTGKLETYTVTTPGIIKNNHYVLTFERPLQGEKFLNDYVVYIKNKTEADFIKHLIKSISDEINTLEQNLMIAEKINLKEPILKEAGDIINIYQSSGLFYDGTIILSQKLIYLKELHNQAKQLKLDYDPILEKASPAYLTQSPYNKKKLIVIFGLLGLFCSFIVIFIKSHLR